MHSNRQGIVHVIGPELGLTQPGMTVVCGDSHTATHGAFGALAFGIGTSEVEQVLATQCLLQRQSKTFQVQVEGRLGAGVTAKDIILALIARIGIGGGTGSVFEYTGSAIRALGMEERMTVCNMSIEGGARAGLVAPDDTTFEYLAGRPHAPQGAAWDAAIARWKQLPTDEGATYDRTVSIDADALEPMITYGTNPGMGVSDHRAAARTLAGGRPDGARFHHQGSRLHGSGRRQAAAGTPGGRGLHRQLHQFADHRSAHRGRPAEGPQSERKVRVMVVPGSQEVKRQAKAEGLPEIFRAAGCEWREPGCSMCIAMNGDQLRPANTAFPPAIAISKDGRARAGARSWPAR